MENEKYVRNRLNGMLVAKFISDTGTWISVVLILLYTNEVAVVKAQGISLVFALRVLMPLLLTPMLAKFVDRFPTGKWLVACDLLAASIALAIPYSNSVMTTAIVAGTLSTVTAIHFSAFNRLLKAYTPKGKIKASILKQSLLEGISLLGGTSLAGIVGSQFSFKVGFAMDALSFVASAAVVMFVFGFYKVKNVKMAAEVQEEKPFKILSIRTMPWLLLISTFAAICFGLRDTTLIQLMVNELGMQKGIYAIAVAVGGAGGILGNLFANRISLRKAYAGLVIVFFAIAILYAGIAFSKSALLLFPVTFMLGLIEACYYYFRSHIFFTITPDDHLARGAGLFKIFNATARSGGVLIIGLGFSFLQPSQQFVLFAVIALVAASVSYFFRPSVVESK
ncbi:MFS transporter [Bdellovibrio sp.]|uniref:MFS transporter n=1 Tax=Bdellovibrio sp. TaxID=28201 RepID=UPI003221B9D5